jgi:hypothetical protein
MPVSLPKVLISFSCLIDLKEVPIDEYNRQLLPESKSTQMGNPAWMICKYAMFWPCCSLFSFKALLYILDTCVIFLRLFHSVLFHFIVLYFVHGALFYSWRFYFLAKSFCSSFSKCKKALYHSALFKFS